MAETRKKIRFKDLSPEAREVIKAKRLAGRRRVGEWQGLIAELGNFDAITDRIEDRNTFLLGLSVLMVGAALVGFLVVWAMDGETAYQVVRIASYAVGGAGLLLVLYSGCRLWQCAKLNLMNDFRLCIGPLLDVLAEDVPPKAKVRMDLDLKGLNLDKQVKKGEIEPGRYDKVVETVWHDPWCHLALPLADGSRAALDIENRFISHRCSKTRTRQRASGKYKTKRKVKTKWKKIVVVSTTVVPNARLRQWDEGWVSARAARDKVKLADKQGARVCRLVRKCKFRAVDEEPKDVAEPKAIVAQFMELLKLLRPLQAEA